MEENRTGISSSITGHRFITSKGIEIKLRSKANEEF